MVCFLHDALEGRVHFERLGDCLAAIGSEVVLPETAKKTEKERKVRGRKEGSERERKKSARAKMCQGADQAWLASGM